MGLALFEGSSDALFLLYLAKFSNKISTWGHLNNDFEPRDWLVSGVHRVLFSGEKWCSLIKTLAQYPTLNDLWLLAQYKPSLLITGYSHANELNNLLKNVYVLNVGINKHLMKWNNIWKKQKELDKTTRTDRKKERERVKYIQWNNSNEAAGRKTRRAIPTELIGNNLDSMQADL